VDQQAKARKKLARSASAGSEDKLILAEKVQPEIAEEVASEGTVSTKGLFGLPWFGDEGGDADNSATDNNDADSRASRISDARAEIASMRKEADNAESKEARETLLKQMESKKKTLAKMIEVDKAAKERKKQAKLEQKESASAASKDTAEQPKSEDKAAKEHEKQAKLEQKEGASAKSEPEMILKEEVEPQSSTENATEDPVIADADGSLEEPETSSEPPTALAPAPEPDEVNSEGHVTAMGFLGLPWFEGKNDADSRATRIENARAEIASMRKQTADAESKEARLDLLKQMENKKAILAKMIQVDQQAKARKKLARSASARSEDKLILAEKVQPSE